MATLTLPDTLAAVASPSTAALQARLAFPRENGSEALQRAHAVLDSALGAAGVNTLTVPFPCQALRAEAAACWCALAAVLLVRAAWGRARRSLVVVAAATALAVATGMGSCDRLLPSTTERVLIARVPPRAPARREILLSAHYDSKTELLDHVQRSVLFGVTAAGLLATAILAWQRRRLLRPVGLTTSALLVAAAAQLGLGRWLGTRSLGVLDDGAACVLLADLAASYARSPLHHTRLTCVWFAGEEVGAQGSSALADQLAAADVHACINLEAVGAGSEVVLTRYEMHGARVYRTPPAVRAWLTHAAGRPLRDLALPLWTDAGPLLRAGLPAITVLTMPAGSRGLHGLHGAGDAPARFDARGEAEVRALLRRCLALADVP